MGNFNNKKRIFHKPLHRSLQCLTSLPALLPQDPASGPLPSERRPLTDSVVSTDPASTEVSVMVATATPTTAMDTVVILMVASMVAMVPMAMAAILTTVDTPVMAVMVTHTMAPDTVASVTVATATADSEDLSSDLLLSLEKPL